MILKRLIRVVVIIPICMGLLSGCGTEVPGPNRSPVAIAGVDQMVAAGQEALLDGRASFDPDGDSLHFQWTVISQPDGSLATLTDDMQALARLSPDAVGIWAIRLTVSDRKTVSPADLIVVRATGCRQDEDCDDGLWCNGEESCLQGICMPGTRDCSVVGDACNEFTCDEAEDACRAVPLPDGTVCADPSCEGLLWMTSSCQAGGCVAEQAADCDDLNTCTRDACFTSGCNHSPQPVGLDCSDDLYCNGDEACDGAGTCLEGNDPCPGLYCDEDLNLCTGCVSDDNCPACQQCVDTVCQPLEAGTPCGDPNNNNCTSPDTCDGVGSCLPNHAPTATPCNDFQFCNGADACDGNGNCLHHVGDPCNSGDECNRECNEVDDNCFNPAGTACADQLDGDCTNPDGCDGAGFCLPNHEPDSIPCDDGLYCNGSDNCDGLGSCGSHAGDPCAGGASCNQLCNETEGNCLDPAGSPCQDVFYCNGADSCDGSGGCTMHAGDPCVGGGECNQDCIEGLDHCFDPAGTPCGDDTDTSCTNPDNCDGAGLCLARHANPGTWCDDGQYCNGNDSCDGAGACGTHLGDPCLAGAECNRVCNEADGSCVNPLDDPCGDPADTECSDPDSCDGLGTCRDNHAAAGSACDIEPCSSLDSCDGGGTCMAGAVDKDTDGDGVIDQLCPGGTDCNDSDPDMSPDLFEGPYGDPYCADAKDNDCDGLTDDQELDCAAPTNCAWWWGTLAHRRRLQVVNQTSAVLEQGYTVVLELDHQAMVSAGLSYESGGDLRIVWCDGANNHQLYRVDDAQYSLPSQPTSFNTANARIAFATQADIGPWEADNEYFLYYDPINAITGPPLDPSRVYLWYDTFDTWSTQSYDMHKWVDLHGNTDEYVEPWFNSFNEILEFDTGEDHQTSLYPDLPPVADVLIETIFWSDQTYPNDGSVALSARVQPLFLGTHYYVDFSHGIYDSPGISMDTWLNGERNHLVYNEPSPYYWSFNDHHTIRYAVFGTTHKFWWNQEIDQPADIEATDTTHTGPGRFGFVGGQIRGHLDVLRARRYTEPEPVITAGPQEP